MIAPLTAVQDAISGYGGLSNITVQARSRDALDAAQAEVTSILEDRKNVTDPSNPGFQVANQGSVRDASDASTKVFTTLLGAVAAISLLVGGIGVMNIMLVSVTERTREIGIRKAIGARRSDILGQFLTEAVLVSLLGGLLGVVAGIARQPVRDRRGAADAERRVGRPRVRRSAGLRPVLRDLSRSAGGAVAPRRSAAPRMTEEHHHMTEPEIDTESLPARRRRAGVTPAIIALAAILVTVLGFIGGVQVQKARGDESGTGSAVPAGFQRATGAGGGQGGASSDTTTGTVKSKRGSSLYVETQDGTTVRVTTGDDTNVVRTAKGTTNSVHPGDSVVIQGSTKDGSVKAADVRATADGVSAGGFPGGFGGGGDGAPGAAPPQPGG